MASDSNVTFSSFKYSLRVQRPVWQSFLTHFLPPGMTQMPTHANRDKYTNVKRGKYTNVKKDVYTQGTAPGGTILSHQCFAAWFDTRQRRPIKLCQMRLKNIKKDLENKNFTHLCHQVWIKCDRAHVH